MRIPRLVITSDGKKLRDQFNTMRLIPLILFRATGGKASTIRLLILIGLVLIRSSETRLPYVAKG